jgi:hypothetical protein
MIVWGGSDAAGTALTDGARYDPTTDTWAPLESAGAPAARARHVAVFTGDEMLVWGGASGATRLADGGRYVPGTGWGGAIPADSAPAPRDLATAVWTGREMIVWGGEATSGGPFPAILSDGARYRPGVGWVGATSTSFGAVRSMRLAHAAAWDGEEMIVWGGYGAVGTGGRYRPPIALPPGTYSASISVEDPDASPPSADIPVTLTVTRTDRLAVAVDVARVTAAGGGLGDPFLAPAPDGGAWLASSFGGPAGTVVQIAPDDAAGTTLTVSNHVDAFLARFDSAGGLVSARRLTTAPFAGSGTNANLLAIAAAPDGSLRVAGSLLFGSAVFDAGGPRQTTVSGRGFVARYDADGSLAWARGIGGTVFLGGMSLAVAADGSALLAGTGAQAAFGPGEPNETSIGSPGFLARYGADGALAWAVPVADGAQTLGGQPRVALAADASGAATIAGTFHGSATFGTGPGAVTLASGSGDEVFVARYAPDGSLGWARQSVGGTALGLAVALAGDGGAWVTGNVQSSVDGTTFGSGEPGATSLRVPLGNLFVARYRPDGSLAFARSATSQPVLVTTQTSSIVTGQSNANAVVALPAGGALVAGSFETVCTLWPGELVSAGGADVLVLRVDDDGSIRWARGGGGPADDAAAQAALASDGACLVAGTFRQTATFGSGEADETALTAGGSPWDLFLLRVRP